MGTEARPNALGKHRSQCRYVRRLSRSQPVSHGASALLCADHTLGTPTGWYIYMEASYPQVADHRCRIVSEEITGQRCLEFWYHMYGMDIDTLNVYIKMNGQLNKPVWTRSRNQGELTC